MGIFFERLSDISFDHLVVSPSRYHIIIILSLTPSNPSNSFSRKGTTLSAKLKKTVKRACQLIVFQLSTNHPESTVISEVEEAMNQKLYVLGPIPPSTLDHFMAAVAPRVWR